MRKLLLLLSVCLLCLIGCASTPQASRTRDNEAKQFGGSPAAATLYVYRTGGNGDDSVLWVDGRLIGATLPYSFFRVAVDPGEHFLAGLAADNGRFRLQTRPGEVYFVALTVSAGQSLFQLVPPDFGRKVVANCCNLLENWAPGQRPLIR